MIVKLLTEHHLECLSLNGGCTGSSESALVKCPHCRKSHHIIVFLSLKIAFVFTNSADSGDMPHLIWVFTVCKSNHLGVSGPQKAM